MSKLRTIDENEECAPTPLHTPSVGTYTDATYGTEKIKLLDGNAIEYPKKPMEEPLCSCRKTSIVKRSRTAKNPGRLFFSCANAANNRCDFFVWSEYKPYIEYVLNYPEDAIYNPYKYLKQE